MIATLEGRHAWTGPDGATATLNYVKSDAGAQVFPRVRITDTNLRTLGDAGSISDPRVGGPGEIPRRSFRRGRPVAYSGYVEARTLRDFEDYAEDLLTAFADISSEGRMDVTWHPRLGSTFPAMFYEARALGLEIGEPTLSTNLYRGSFVLALRNHDGRFFQAGATATATIVTTNATYSFA